MLGDHDLLVKGAFFYDACVRVPLLMRWPGIIDAGARVPGTVQPNDLAAPILSAAGCLTAEARRRMPESRDLLAGAGKHSRRYVVTGTPGSSTTWSMPRIRFTRPCCRTGDWKLNHYHTPLPADGQLFNLRDDPGETRNLWADYSHREDRLRLTDQLNQWMLAREFQSGSRGGESFPAAAQKAAQSAALKCAGYTGGDDALMPFRMFNSEFTRRP